MSVPSIASTPPPRPASPQFPVRRQDRRHVPAHLAQKQLLRAHGIGVGSAPPQDHALDGSAWLVAEQPLCRCSRRSRRPRAGHVARLVGPSRTAHPRIQELSPFAATGSVRAHGFAHGSAPLPARDPLSPAHGDPVARPATPLQTLEQHLSPLPTLVPSRSLVTDRRWRVCWRGSVPTIVPACFAGPNPTSSCTKSSSEGV